MCYFVTTVELLSLPPQTPSPRLGLPPGGSAAVPKACRNMSDGAKSWVGDTHEPSRRAAVKDHGTKRRLSPASSLGLHLTLVRNIHPNVAAEFKQAQISGLVRGSCTVCVASPVEESRDASKEQITIFPRVRPSSSLGKQGEPLTCLTSDKIWTQILHVAHFQGIFLDGERRGRPVLMSRRPELGSLGSVDSSPKAPQELVGTCEGPSSVTGLGSFFLSQTGRDHGRDLHFYHPHLGRSRQCFHHCTLCQHEMLNYGDIEN